MWLECIASAALSFSIAFQDRNLDPHEGSVLRTARISLPFDSFPRHVSKQVFDLRLFVLQLPAKFGIISRVAAPDDCQILK